MVFWACPNCSWHFLTQRKQSSPDTFLQFILKYGTDAVKTISGNERREWGYLPFLQNLFKTLNIPGVMYALVTQKYLRRRCRLSMGTSVADVTLMFRRWWTVDWLLPPSLFSSVPLCYRGPVKTTLYQWILPCEAKLHWYEKQTILLIMEKHMCV